jgi:hypothetical protein
VGRLARTSLLRHLAASRQLGMLFPHLSKLTGLRQITGALPRPGRHHERCSTAGFHTNRAYAQYCRNTASRAGKKTKRYRDLREA